MSVNKKRKALLHYKKKMKQHTAAPVQTVLENGSIAAAARSDVQEVETMKDGETTLGTSSYTSIGTTSPSKRKSHPTNVHLQVLTKQSISKLVKERCESVNLTMKMIERCPDAHDKRIDAEIQMELERIDETWEFLDGLVNGRRFISLPADCTLHGARRLLQQLQIAEGFRAIAIESSDSSLSLEETALTTPPRLFLLLPGKSSSNESPEKANDGFFEENLNRLLVDCTLPLPEKMASTTVPREEQASNNIIDPLEDKAQARPAETSTATSQGMQVISSDRALKKAGSLPSEVLTLPLPLLHPSINGWRATSMPTWTSCTHDHHNENIINDPVQSPTSSETSTTYESKVENGKMSPVLASGNAMSTGVGTICTHHQRDTSNSDNTVITVDTSIHSQSDLEEERVCEIRHEQRAVDYPQANQGNGPPSNSIQPDGVARSPWLARPITLQDGNSKQTRNHLQSATESYSYRRSVSSGVSGFMSHNGSKKDNLSSNQARPAARTTWSTQPRNRVHGGSILSLKQPERLVIPPENTPFYKMDPPPCNRHYLLQAGCPSPNCPYSHEYIFSQQEIEKLKMDSRKSPCTALKAGLPCSIGPEECHMGHVCPYGRECRYGRACKFLEISGTHDCNPVNEHFYRTAMCQKGELTISIAPSEIPLSPPISPQSVSYKEVNRVAEQATRRSALPAPSLKGLRIHIPMKKQFVGQPLASWTLPPHLPQHPCTPYYKTAPSPPIPRYQGVYPPLHAGPFPMTPIEPMMFRHVMPYPMQALPHPSLAFSPPHLSGSIFQSAPIHSRPQTTPIVKVLQ